MRFQHAIDCLIAWAAVGVLCDRRLPYWHSGLQAAKDVIAEYNARYYA